MTTPGESRKEAMRQKLQRPSLTTPKQHLKLGCWNVRTMYQIDKTANIVREFKSYNINVVGISEMRWTGFGEVKTTTGETILYSGSDNSHHHGVGLILDKTSRESMITWKPVNDRIISARFFSKFVKLTVIQIYSPTNDSNDDEKDTFYE
ncbi:craniofacial development protein 2-like [Ostrea edulis]|uniref:craniofacial development protein 2-like n=1 Tax=Ostrea edulis TaxID=37623 RepID=UPI0024AFB423|nr:craniofacial development protein 2-like [Ostrea edulis]